MRGGGGGVALHTLVVLYEISVGSDNVLYKCVRACVRMWVRACAPVAVRACVRVCAIMVRGFHLQNQDITAT